MSKNPKVIDKDARIAEAFEIMEKKNISQLIVVDNGKTVGLLSDLELMDRLGSSKLGNISPAGIHVSGVMREISIFVNPEDDITYVAKTMLREKLPALPVLEDDNITGVISYFDTIKPCVKIENIKVYDLFSTIVPTVKPEDRVVNARRVLLENQLIGLPVIYEDQLVGLLTQRMVAKAMIAFREVVPSKHQDARIKHLIVQDIMLQDPPAFDIEMKISEAAQYMISKLYRCIPVLNEKNKVVGILSSRDFTKFASKNFTI